MEYSDAAFANNSELSSQLGRVVLFTDESNKAIPLLYSSYKSRRATRSVLSAEMIVFADLPDDVLAISKQLEIMLQRTIPVHMSTGSKSLFDIIAKGSRTNEKRNMLDMYAARQAYNDLEIINIGFVRNSYNLATGLTKPKLQAALFELLITVHHEPRVEQCIYRDSNLCTNMCFNIPCGGTKHIWNVAPSVYEVCRIQTIP